MGGVVSGDANRMELLNDDLGNGLTKLFGFQQIVDFVRENAEPISLIDRKNSLFDEPALLDERTSGVGIDVSLTKRSQIGQHWTASAQKLEVLRCQRAVRRPAHVCLLYQDPCQPVPTLYLASQFVSVW